MRITIIGDGGYVGLITAVGFARLGHDVVAVDINEKSVASLSAGTSPIHEAGLDVALKAVLADGNVLHHQRRRWRAGCADRVRHRGHAAAP